MVTGEREKLLAKARPVRLVVTDCDGVLTDGTVWCSAAGEEAMRFSRRDGMGVERLRALAGVETAIVSRENSRIVRRRAEKLGIVEVLLGIRDKADAVGELALRHGLHPAALAYMGDDVNDLDAMDLVGLSACPSDALPLVLSLAGFVADSPGGHGAFRELAELVLSTRTQPVPRPDREERHAVRSAESEAASRGLGARDRR